MKANEVNWKCTYFIAPFFLISCNGYAPLLTCHDPCEKSYETRDSFCVCQDYRNVGTPPPPPLPPPPPPSFYWQWEEANGCSLNRHYWLINPSKKRLIVDVSWRIPNSIDREHREYTINGNITSSNYKDGVDLGFEESPIPNSSCHDKDFMVNGWREPNYATAIQSAIATLDSNKENLLLQRDQRLALLQTQITQQSRTAEASQGNLSPDGHEGSPSSTPAPQAKIVFHTNSIPKITIKEQEALNCQEVCDSGDTLRCPIVGYPPDKEKLRTLMDKLRAPADKPEFQAADIYQIFGLDKASCARSDIKTANNKLFNTGRYCVFPMFLQSSDTKPKLSLHFPETIRALKIGTGSVGGMVFNAGVATPTLYFADPELHTNFGGVVTDATASDKGVYYQTTSACIFMGIR
ncbi:hypothetical protein [Pseudomonas sp. 10-1B]|uniref:hypothetical protein n=1 Tax=Pseudomonas sp. 10-1B TaxID=1546029 RepID=UPI000AC42A36|nr:hypothetical protein [Pseudomonas sp. 10-1B]